MNLEKEGTIFEKNGNVTVKNKSNKINRFIEMKFQKERKKKERKRKKLKKKINKKNQKWKSKIMM